MMIELREADVFDVGPFRLDAQLRELSVRESGERVALAPKAIDVLIALVVRAGEVVTKDQILDEVWDNVFVEESNLSQTIFVLRKALGDDTKKPRFILTVPNRGYRFIADVTPRERGSAALFVQPKKSEPAAAPKTAATAGTFIYVAVTSLVVLVSIALLIMILGSGKRDSSDGLTAIAILPFRNLGPETDNFIAAGLSETMTTKLSNLKSVVLRPSASTLKYADSNAEPKQIGAELAVEILVTGSIQRNGETIRVNVQITRVDDGATVWGRIYDDQYRALFGIQDRMSQDLAEAISANHTPDERARIAKNYTSNPDAQSRYFQGLYLWNKRTPQSLMDAIVEFKKAIELEPGYVHAYIGLANCYAVLANYGVERPSEANPKAREAIDMALRIDDRLAEAYAARGTIQAYYDWDWKAADDSFRRAIEINPNYATGQQWYAEFLFEVKRYEEAFRRYQVAIRLDPRSPIIRTSFASRFLYLGENEKVLELMKVVHEIDANYGYGYFHEGLAFEKMGREREAFESFAKAMLLQGEPADCVDEARAAFSRGGLREYWNVRLSQLLHRPHLKNFPPNGVASVYARIGDKEKTIEYLQKGLAERDPWMVGLSHPIFFNLVADDQRYQEILRRLNFPPG